MKGLRWRALNLATAVSCLVFVVAAALWVRSRTHSDRIWFSLGSRLVVVEVQSQGISWAIVSGWNDRTAFEHSSGTNRRVNGPDFVAHPNFRKPPRDDADVINLPGIQILTSTVGVFFRTGGLTPDSAFSTTQPAYGFRALNLRYAAILSYMAIFPVVWLSLAMRRKFIESRRLRAGLCVICGYDLRATPDRCPACGAVSEAAKGEAR